MSFAQSAAKPLFSPIAIADQPRFLPTNWGAAARAVVLSIAGVSLFILVLDALVFRAALPADYVAFYTSPLEHRTAAAMLGSLMEEVKYRLLVMTLLLLVFTRFARSGAIWPVIVAIVAAQFVNVVGPIIQLPVYSLFRFWLVGCVWGLLYWRHGWAAAAIAHPLTHLVMDPLLRVALS